MSPPFVTMRGIGKTFGAVRALRRVDFEVGHGEIVGLVGDNAAGKSTLMKVLSGVYTADVGEILIEGTPARLRESHGRHAPPASRWSIRTSRSCRS